LERLIREAGRVPVERDTLYRPIDRSKMPPTPLQTGASLSIIV
jgi:2-iminoacetate synthase ThiH